MAVDITIPSPGESILEVEVGEWQKSVGDWVQQDEVIVVIETDKANLEIPSPVAGVLTAQSLDSGAVAKVGDVVGVIDPNAKPAAGAPAAPAAATPTASPTTGGHVMPAAARAGAVLGVDTAQVAGSGPGGRVLKEDVQRAAAAKPAPAAPSAPAPAPAPAVSNGPRHIETVPMSRLRRTIASRLVAAQQTAALLTTFNEVDMSAVMALRSQYKEDFLKKHGTKLGFMSFFVKATIEALKVVPGLNAQIDGSNIVYHDYYDIGVAVGGGKGLVVPVIRNAEMLSFAEIEKTIRDYGQRAQAGNIKLDELLGGTFSISNGGVYGSMLSTPIINPPQSGILGMHNIVDRPVAVDGKVEIRPIMYLALTYDHRIVDGKGAVTALNTIKSCLENPARMLLEV